MERNRGVRVREVGEIRRKEVARQEIGYSVSPYYDYFPSNVSRSSR